MSESFNKPIYLYFCISLFFYSMEAYSFSIVSLEVEIYSDKFFIRS